MEYLRKMKVYKKVPTQRRKDLTWQRAIKVRWVDTNWQDVPNPKREAFPGMAGARSPNSRLHRLGGRMALTPS